MKKITITIKDNALEFKYRTNKPVGENLLNTNVISNNEVIFSDEYLEENYKIVGYFIADLDKIREFKNVIVSNNELAMLVIKVIFAIPKIECFTILQDDNLSYELCEAITKAKNIIANNSTSKLKIGCLYLESYAYNFENHQSLTIVNVSDTRNMLLINLIISLFLVGLGEFIIYMISKKITEWITKPVLESFDREKGFVANASHELKTPLAVMMASIDCLEVNKKNEKWIHNLKSESDRMNHLITRLLDLSKTEYLKKKVSMN